MLGLVSAKSIIFFIGEGSIDWTLFEIVKFNSHSVQLSVWKYLVSCTKEFAKFSYFSFEMFTDFLVEEFGAEGLSEFLHNLFNCDPVSFSPQLLQQ